MNRELKESVFKLPRNERRRLAEKLWDSVRDEDIQTTPAHLKLLRKRLAEVRAHPAKCIPLPEFQKGLRELAASLRRKHRRSA